MKHKILYTLISLLGLTAARAVTPYVGASVGYLVDTEKPLYSARVGAEVHKQAALTHSLEAEILYCRDHETYYQYLDSNLDLTGLMANYKLSFDGGQRLYASVGGGIGSTHVDAKIRYIGYDVYTLKDYAFTYQLIGTVGCKLTAKAALEASVRYLNIGDVKDDIEVGDDVSLELGLKFRF